MSEYVATVRWARDTADFRNGRYSRAHVWAFDGGVEVPASASPHVVPAPMSRFEAVDPEEAFVASLASCHMLWFLALAAKRGFVVDRYVDAALGVMEEDATGRLAITRVTLRPHIVFGGESPPSAAQLAELHHAAHDRCFIANSVKTEVTVAAPE